jgi:polyisoprenoid-binding protein YceI
MALGAATIALGIGAFLSIGGSQTASGQGSEDEAPMQIETTEANIASGTASQPEEDAAEPETQAVDEAQAEAEAEQSPTGQAAPPPQWAIQPGGRLAFSVGNAGETIGGSFSRWSGTITMDTDRPETADIAITVDLTSASVGDASQDGMLRGAEFFDTSNFASATFRASSARRTGGNSYSARGTLDLKGQSRPQTITFRLTGSGLTRHVEGSATIARADFGIGTGSSGENLAPNVAVSFSFDAEAR